MNEDQKTLSFYERNRGLPRGASDFVDNGRGPISGRNIISADSGWKFYDLYEEFDSLSVKWLVDNLKEKLEERGVSILDLCAHADCGHANVYNIIAGKSVRPSVPLMAKLFHCLGYEFVIVPIGGE